MGPGVDELLMMAMAQSTEITITTGNRAASTSAGAPGAAASGRRLTVNFLVLTGGECVAKVLTFASFITLLAFVRHKNLNMVNAFGRQHLFEARQMALLSARLPLELFLDRRLATGEGIGRKWHRGIGTIGLKACLQRSQPPFQLGYASVAFQASGARQNVYAAMLESRGPTSCASFAKIR
jgi:hypothetical protein